MPNQKYSQVTDLLVQGKLRWATDAISALLFTGVTFNAAHKRVSQLGKGPIKVVPLQGRYISEGGAALGHPATFNQVDADTPYQVIIAQDDGTHDFNLLAFIDTNQDDDPLTIQEPGTLIVRPVQEIEVTLPDTTQVIAPPIQGLWMRLV